MGRRGHDPVLRRRAIDLLESGKSVKEVTEELGVSDQSIYTWSEDAAINNIYLPIWGADHEKLIEAILNKRTSTAAALIHEHVNGGLHRVAMYFPETK